MIQCISPVDGSIHAERPAASMSEAIGAVTAARQAQCDWAARPLDERTALVRAGIAKLGEQQAEMAVELAWMMGRPVRYGGEFGGVEERASYMADIASDALAPVTIEASDRFERRIEREPHGVVLVIAPWNYPYLTAINAVAPSLIAGNAVILKPSRQTLLSGERLARAFHEAGVPEAVFQNLFLTHETTTALIANRQADFVNFTGSVAGGREIERAAAGTFVGVGLELGGKDPGYVMEDADIDAAADTLIDGAMFNSGQCCCGIERIYVHKRRFDDFVDKALSIAGNLKLGNPLEPETSLGPMASPRFASLVRAQTKDAIEQGAKALIDAKKFPEDDGGSYLMPQILIQVGHEMGLMRDENFGPVVGIMPVADDGEALALMNDSAFGLTASLWTGDVARAAAIGARLETGTVFMNRCDYLDPALCWTGCKNTGRGASLSFLGFHAVTRPKSYHLKKA